MQSERTSTYAWTSGDQTALRIKFHVLHCQCSRVVCCLAHDDTLYNAALNRPVFASSELLNWVGKYNFYAYLANDGYLRTLVLTEDDVSSQSLQIIHGGLWTSVDQWRLSERISPTEEIAVVWWIARLFHSYRCYQTVGKATIIIVAYLEMSYTHLCLPMSDV